MIHELLLYYFTTTTLLLTFEKVSRKRAGCLKSQCTRVSFPHTTLVLLLLVWYISLLRVYISLLRVYISVLRVYMGVLRVYMSVTGSVYITGVILGYLYITGVILVYLQCREYFMWPVL